MLSRLRAFVVTCHPGPSIAVTAVSCILGASLGYQPSRLLVLGAAILAGHVSIGWSNDWLDAARDAAVQRRDKATVTGVIGPAAVRNAALIAAAAAIPLSFALGLLAGIVHLIGVLAGWSYNAVLKSTPVSIVPYIVFFSLLPLVVTLGLPEPKPAAGWAIAAGALLGAGAHFANVLPDLDDDARTGIRGLPHIVGARASGVAAFVLLIAGAATLTWGAGGTLGSWIGFGLAVVVGAAGTWLALTRPATRTLMRLVVLSALIDVIMLASTGLRP